VSRRRPLERDRAAGPPPVAEQQGRVVSRRRDGSCARPRPTGEQRFGYCSSSALWSSRRSPHSDPELPSRGSRSRELDHQVERRPDATPRPSHPASRVDAVRVACSRNGSTSSSKGPHSPRGPWPRAAPIILLELIPVLAREARISVNAEAVANGEDHLSANLHDDRPARDLRAHRAAPLSNSSAVAPRAGLRLLAMIAAHETAGPRCLASAAASSTGSTDPRSPRSSPRRARARIGWISVSSATVAARLGTELPNAPTWLGEREWRSDRAGRQPLSNSAAFASSSAVASRSVAVAPRRSYRSGVCAEERGTLSPSGRDSIASRYSGQSLERSKGMLRQLSSRACPFYVSSTSHRSGAPFGSARSSTQGAVTTWSRRARTTASHRHPRGAARSVGVDR